ncbi:uncharacterized protein KY384_005455 [Bacidia gigantensis]|uniref:uncharacterized protein n=1 Tax=Bacidia gigantensis TaxID=2732470 RepID=UPI001D03FEC6|nr:uncharacterized protein KY384_005455 [Bacidia gigantensis]KAG8529973.1 hypothetical protein KY384_005455 [Bacidia gigantensis]
MAALKFVRSVWESFRCNSGLEPLLLDNLRISAAQPGKVKFELEIQKQHSNRLGTLHGGTIASLVDLGGSLALASNGLYATGVSTDLNVTYLKAGKIGDLLRAEVICDKLGKNLAFTTSSFFSSKGELIARGSHTKYVALAWKDPNNQIEQMEPEGKAKSE